LTLIGSYYLVTQKLNLNRYYPPDSVQFPELHVPRPLSAITPGPKLTALPGFANTPTPKPIVIAHPAQGFVPHTALKPFTVSVPAALSVTPPPAPAYHVVTPLPMVPVYPAVILNPSPSPTP
jgi:hypothetical protein